MRLQISPDRLISDVQKDFNSAFPYLKLEFLSRRSISRNNFSSGEVIPPHHRIGGRKTTGTEGDIEIRQEMKVNELENIFRDQFSIAAQVYRKSGNLWLETSMTDNWTLFQQNTHGRELSGTSMASSPKTGNEMGGGNHQPADA